VAVRTSSSNGRAVASVVLALLGVLALPAAVALTERSKRVDLLDAAFAIPVAAALGIAALALAVGARRKAEWTLGRAGGSGAARAGRALAVLAICFAVAGAIAVGWYAALTHWHS
jgi:hypothetical protein